MIGLEDRRQLARDIQAAHEAGARLTPACEIAGIDVRTLQRWRARQGLVSGDGRPDALRPTPQHALTPEERQQILRVANEPRFAEVPPARIVPALADEGVYLASESSLQRVLRAQGQTRHRGRAKPPRKGRPPTTHVASAPRQVWCWDMTFLPAAVNGALVLPVPDPGHLQPEAALRRVRPRQAAGLLLQAPRFAARHLLGRAGLKAPEGPGGAARSATT